MSRFFDLDSPLMRALSALLDWFVVSFFTLLCAVPVFTAGAAACGLCEAMGPGGGEPPSLKRFFRGFRRCFRPACLCTLVLLAAGYFFYLYIQAVGALPGAFLGRGPVLPCLFGAGSGVFAAADPAGAGPSVLRFVEIRPDPGHRPSAPLPGHPGGGPGAFGGAGVVSRLVLGSQSCLHLPLARPDRAAVGPIDGACAGSAMTGSIRGGRRHSRGRRPPFFLLIFWRKWVQKSLTLVAL